MTKTVIILNDKNLEEMSDLDVVATTDEYADAGLGVYQLGDWELGDDGIGTTSPNGVLDVNIGTSTDTGLIVNGAPSQSANLQEWQNSTGGVMASIDSGGNITINALSGSGNAYACLNSGGKLYRSATACA